MKFELSTDIEKNLVKQLDFALIRTYTKAAQVAQKAVIDSLPQIFILRNDFVRNSIRMEAATKENPVATVFVPTDGRFNADFLIRQELGGIKTPSGNYLAIPVNVKRTRGNRKGVGGGIIKAQDRPRALLASGEYKSTRKLGNRIFKIDASTPERFRRDLPFGIYAAHANRKKHDKGNKGLTLLYALEPRGKVGARFQFQETALKAAKAAMPALFAESLNEALKSAK